MVKEKCRCEGNPAMVGIGRICPANGLCRNAKRYVSHGCSPRFPRAPLGRVAAVGAWLPGAVKKCLPLQLPVRINFATFAWQRRARPPLGQAGAGWRLGAPRPGLGPWGQAGAGRKKHQSKEDRFRERQTQSVVNKRFFYCLPLQPNSRERQDNARLPLPSHYLFRYLPEA